MRNGEFARLIEEKKKKREEQQAAWEAKVKHDKELTEATSQKLFNWATAELTGEKVCGKYPITVKLVQRKMWEHLEPSVEFWVKDETSGIELRILDVEFDRDWCRVYCANYDLQDAKKQIVEKLTDMLDSTMDTIIQDRLAAGKCEV